MLHNTIAINKALESNKINVFDEIPKHLLNKEIKKGSAIYKYPHDYKNSYVYQQYLPNNIKGDTYYIPKDESKYEQALKRRLQALNPENKKD